MGNEEFAAQLKTIETQLRVLADEIAKQAGDALAGQIIGLDRKFLAARRTTEVAQRYRELALATIPPPRLCAGEDEAKG